MRSWLALGALWSAVPARAAAPAAAAAPAGAGDPVMTVLADRRTVQGVVEIAVDLPTARALVQDPHRTSAAGDPTVSVEDLGPDGACRRVRWTVPHPIKTVSYVGRMCDTAQGAEISLVESDDLDEYASTWAVEALGPDLVRLTCAVRSTPSFPLPASIVRGQIQQELGETLQHIKQALERRR